MDLIKKQKERAKESESPSLADDFEKLKNEYKDLEKEEKELKDYLNINVFDYAQNAQKIEDIFSIKNSSLAFLDKDEITHRINPNIPVVEINNLTKYYSSRKIPSLINVTMKLYLGDVHIVVGSNGSGKTTLFNCLKGIEDYDGEILIDGKELSLNSDFFSDEIISFVDYEFGWDNYSTVSDLISNRFKDLNRTELESQNYIRSSLDSFGISYLRNYHVIDLSLLEKRKVQIAIALITDPHVVVFDEFLLGLQQHEVFEILEVLRKLKGEERSILLFTHTFDKFISFSNSITILSEGKVYYSGSTDKLFTSQVNNYLVSSNDNEKIMEEILKSSSKSKIVHYEYKEDISAIFVKFESKIAIQGFQKECVDRGIIITEFRPMEISLEDLYPVLRANGNQIAIKDINKVSYFSPEN